MAIKSVKEKTALKLQLDGGLVGEKQKFINKSFANVKTNAQDEDLYATAKALEDLQNKDMLNVVRMEEISLIEE